MHAKYGIEIILEAISQMPNSPGVYKMLRQDGQALYIGKAKNLPKRVIYYTQFEKLPYRLKMMVSQVESMEFIATNSEAEALLLEANIIKETNPIYNINLKDDKSFPYILFEDSHPTPRITKYRGNKKLKGEYFGPFPNATAVNLTIKELQKIFLIRPCTDDYFKSRSRPCLEYEIKRCSAPCVKKISETDYNKQFALAKDFMKGKHLQVQENLISQMNEASNNLEFEKAALLRDRIKILSSMQASNIIQDIGNENLDLISIATKLDYLCIQIYFIRNGKNFGSKSYFYKDIYSQDMEDEIEQFIFQLYSQQTIPNKIWLAFDFKDIDILNTAIKSLYGKNISILSIHNSKKHQSLYEFSRTNTENALSQYLRKISHNSSMLEELKSIFNIQCDKIRRVEVYDNSHTFGANQIGCMIVYTPEGFDKKQYKKFNLDNVASCDDYAMMNEVLTRRLKKLNHSQKPDLLLIDGGLGQLSVATEVMNKLNIHDIKIVCISKGENRNAGFEEFHHIPKNLDTPTSFRLPKGSPVLHFLQVLRDEVHRFAIESHRLKRGKQFLQSSLDDISGIGKERKMLLLQYMGSIEKIKEASLQDLERIPGIGKKVAAKIFNFLQKS